jgi:hypothetical protein
MSPPGFDVIEMSREVVWHKSWHATARPTPGSRDGYPTITLARAKGFARPTTSPILSERTDEILELAQATGAS